MEVAAAWPSALVLSAKGRHDPFLRAHPIVYTSEAKRKGEVDDEMSSGWLLSNSSASISFCLGRSRLLSNSTVMADALHNKPR